MANQTKDTARFEEAMNVKLLLRELCQFIDINETNPNALALKALASKVLFALSQNHFGAVFNRISARLQELSATSEENPDFSDIELIQHIDLDVPRLTKLLTGTQIQLSGLSKCEIYSMFLFRISRNESKVPFVEEVGPFGVVNFAGEGALELDRISSAGICRIATESK